MRGGWIKINRSILEWEWYDDINVCRLFIHMLIKANYESKKWQGIMVNRGQLISSTESLAIETALTRQQVRTSLAKLKATNEIEQKSTNKYTLYTIVNYDKHQVIDDDINQQATNKQPANNQQITSKITTTKEIKNLRKKERGAAVALPDWIPKEDWEAFLEMRMGKRDKPTERALELVIGKLDKMRLKGISPAQVLQESVIGGWSGVYEPKQEKRQEARRPTANMVSY